MDIWKKLTIEHCHENKEMREIKIKLEKKTSGNILKFIT